MTAPSWAGPIRTVDGRDEVLVPCDTCGGPVYESCRTRWRERGRRDCGVFCDFLGVADEQCGEVVQPVPGSTPEGRSGWCGRGAHHRCVGAYDAVCGCACHEPPGFSTVFSIEDRNSTSGEQAAEVDR